MEIGLLAVVFVFAQQILKLLLEIFRAPAQTVVLDVMAVLEQPLSAQLVRMYLMFILQDLVLVPVLQINLIMEPNAKIVIQVA